MKGLLKIDVQLLAAGTGHAGAGAYYWLSNVNEILQFVSLAISIVLGAYALYRLYKNAK